MPAGSLVGYMESHDEERTGFKAWKWGNTGVPIAVWQYE